MNANFNEIQTKMYQTYAALFWVLLFDAFPDQNKSVNLPF